MKHFIIVDHRAHLIANKVWSDLSIRAAAYEYDALVWPVASLERYWWTRWLHAILARLFEAVARGRSVWALGASKTPARDEKVRRGRIVFFFGWMFRDVPLMEKYRARLLARVFDGAVQKEATQLLADSEGKMRIGVRLRTRPLKGLTHGEYLVSKKRVDEIVAEYIQRRGLDSTEIALLEVPDETERDDLVGLCVLSQCDVVIGDNSSFSNLAAWLGNVPHIVTTDTPIDWSYYQDREGYFENKYATFAYGSLKL